MKISHTLSLLTALVTPSLAYWKGFNIKSNSADGSTCKSPEDWQNAFQGMKSFPNSINAARLFSSHLCDSLKNAVPAAISAGTLILVGIKDDDSVFEQEKGALIDAIAAHGFDWMVGISVGSESLYRGAITPDSLAWKVNDVRSMVRGLPGYGGQRIQVGHVDTTNAWFDLGNAAVHRACDFIGVDVYPYFQSDQDNHISNAGNLFWGAIAEAQKAVADAGSDASVWVTETGWPVNGNAIGNAVPSVQNAATYFNQVACTAFGKMNTFWFTFQDWYAEPSFAVVNADGQKYFEMDCSSGNKFVKF